MKKIKKLIVYLNIIRFLPHICLYRLSKNRSLILEDLDAYKKEYKITGGNIYSLLHFLFHNKSFRVLFYYRIGDAKFLISFLAKGISNFTISKGAKIDTGILFFHSYSTIINAYAVGKNCRILHNVTLGFKNGKAPTILNNVEIFPNAVIVGGITIGNNCVIGPGAVVIKSIPDNCVVVGNPSYILKQDGVIVNKKL